MSTTKRKKKAGAEADGKLRIEIRQHGKVLRTVEIPDPRAVWCEHFNHNQGMKSQGIEAYPVFSKTRRA